MAADCSRWRRWQPMAAVAEPRSAATEPTAAEPEEERWARERQPVRRSKRDKCCSCLSVTLLCPLFPLLPFSGCNFPYTDYNIGFLLNIEWFFMYVVLFFFLIVALICKVKECISRIVTNVCRRLLARRAACSAPPPTPSQSFGIRIRHST